MDLKRQLKIRNWQQKYSLYRSYFVCASKFKERNSLGLSVIIVSWRFHPHTLKNFILLQKQREFNNFELIFVDNGAMPDSFTPLMTYIDTYIRLNTNTGACIARNIGATFAQAPVLLFLEDDGIPDLDIIESHILIHKRFKPYSVRGVYLPYSNNKLNERQDWYYIGDFEHNRYCDIEGNASYRASVFFAVGGWNDNIFYGGEGKELAIKIWKKYPDISKQIYSPNSIIYHDYADNEQQLSQKNEKQQQSFLKMKSKYDEWDKFDRKWGQYIGEYHLLKETNEWRENDNNKEVYTKLVGRVKRRNREYISRYMDGKVFLHQIDFFHSLSTKKELVIFGAGTKGKIVYKVLKRFGIEITSFTDNNSSLHGQLLFEKPILPIKQLSKDYFILIASYWDYQIAEQLIENGFKRNIDFKTVIG